MKDYDDVMFFMALIRTIGVCMVVAFWTYTILRGC